MTSFAADLAAARRRVRAGARLVDTAAGPIEIVSLGTGVPVLWVHGVVGGADQGELFSAALLGPGFRVIAVSRFGYLGTPLPADGSPAAQADQYAALLDALGLDEVVVIGFSAGAPSCLQFALRHSRRCAGLALVSMAVPGAGGLPDAFRVPARAFFGSDRLQWLIARYWPSLMLGIMGIPAPVRTGCSAAERDWSMAAMRSLMPFSARIDGILNDSFVTVPDLRRRYPLEDITVPVLVVHAADDPMPPVAIAEAEARRMPAASFVQFATGGHLLIGHQGEVRELLAGFVRSHAGAATRLG